MTGENLAAGTRVSRLVTVTGPGRDVLPWDLGRCVHPPGVPCSGTRGCRVDPDAAAFWNEDENERWHLLNDRIQRTIVENTGGRALIIVWVREEQRRGILHRHLVFDLSTPQRRLAARIWCYEYAKIARFYGYGTLDVGLKGFEARSWKPESQPVPELPRNGNERGRVVSYLAKYMSKGLASLRQLGARGTGYYVHREMTMRTNYTRGSLKRRRLAYVLSGPDLPYVVAAIAVAQNFGPVAGFPRNFGLAGPAPPS